MIGYLKGNVISFENGTVIIENNGIGFEVNCSSSVYNKLVAEKFGEAYIYTSVKEDGIALFGFSSVKEKDLFLNLISVSGVGPKMGISVLSQMDMDSVINAIVSSNVKAISQIKGLGKKTAERIILELHDKFCSGEADVLQGITENSATSNQFEKEYGDAIEALTGLGFNKQESVNAVKTAVNNGAKDIQSILAYALKNIR